MFHIYWPMQTLLVHPKSSLLHTIRVYTGQLAHNMLVCFRNLSPLVGIATLCRQALTFHAKLFSTSQAKRLSQLLNQRVSSSYCVYYGYCFYIILVSYVKTSLLSQVVQSSQTIRINFGDLVAIKMKLRKGWRKA